MKDQPITNEKTVPRIFERCWKFNKIEPLKEQGLYPYFRVISSAQDTEVIVNGKKIIMLGSNSYMGLTNDPRVKEAAIKAIQKYGTGCAGSRFLNGTLDIHIELERRLAEFVEKEDALAFTTGYQVNVGTIGALVGKRDYVIIDKTDHASIIDGSRMAAGEILQFDHNNMADLESVLQSLDEKAGKLIVVDGIYSMEGDIAPLPDICRLAKKYNAAVMVDDAHSIGVLGKWGNGTASHFDLVEDVDLIMGTFSKSLASIGGWIAGKKEIINYLKHHARALIFSASISPPNAAAALASLDIIINEPWRREKLWENTRYMLENLKGLGFDTGAAETPIIPVVIGDVMGVFHFWRRLHDEGLFINPVVPPAVPISKSLVRVSVMATHTRDQLDFALEKFEKVGKEMGIIS
ncbi:aminotransferase class I/II-fold pyridoxal phosphate-dependent enzyme [Candidatus Sumerlaeota bacterium]|nr:aminotransferase class I/II-fold pyridoxal phosphate-dependent enzyme [Candidatus Sumerlaeota bacterium]